MHVLRMILVGVVAFCATVGCQSITPGKIAAVRPVSDAPRAGNAYLLRGWIGVFSEGIDNLTGKVNAAGVRAHAFQDDQWSALAKTIREQYRGRTGQAEPLILVGHSYGADDVVRIARKLREDNIPVDLLVTLDPVTPPDVPDNVKHCLNLYQSNGVMDSLPWLRGIPLKAESPEKTRLVNADIRIDRKDLLEPGVDHFNIEKKGKIHDEVIKHITEVCPPRAKWVAIQQARHLATRGLFPEVPVRSMSLGVGTLSPGER